MNGAEVCRAVHEMLAALPAFEDPRDVTIKDGLYFFYEGGECSPHAPSSRVVRIGNHPRSDGTLVRRLTKTALSGPEERQRVPEVRGGRVDASRRSRPPVPCASAWKRPLGAAEREVRDRCRPVEQRVSLLLRTRFWFRCVAIRQREERNLLEELLTATLSCCSVCQPSRHWLGQHAYSDIVREMGVWNSQFTAGTPMSAAELARFADHVDRTRTV